MASPLSNTLGLVTLLVRDYDEAINFYTKKVGFNLVADEKISDTVRWVVISPAKESPSTTGILLAQPTEDAQIQCIGNQAGGRVWLFLWTNNFEEQYNLMKNNGVEFCETPRDEVYGMVVVWKDLYGNKWDLIQRKI